MQIRSENDLKLAYETINSFKEMMPMAQKTDVALEYIKELKRDIRAFFRKEKEKPQRRLVKDDGIDGYIVLIQLPSFLNSKEDAAVYFEENEVMTCRRSMYGCTGQAFTSWYKIVERSGSMWAYHSVCFDV